MTSAKDKAEYNSTRAQELRGASPLHLIQDQANGTDDLLVGESVK